MALSFKQLCDHFDVKQSAALKRLLKKRGIRWLPDRNNHPTTSEAELDRAISREKRRVTFTKPPCRKKNSRSLQESARSTAHGTTSNGTSGGNYAG